jgi:hypothetical protein
MDAYGWAKGLHTEWQMATHTYPLFVLNDSYIYFYYQQSPSFYRFRSARKAH